MANIIYGRSLNPAGKDNAKFRRNARRAEEAIEAREIEAILATALGTEPPERRQELSRAELICKRKPAMQADRLVTNPYTQQILAGAAAYVEYRMNGKYQKVCNEAGRTIHAVQKRKGQSIPLI